MSDFNCLVETCEQTGINFDPVLIQYTHQQADSVRPTPWHRAIATVNLMINAYPDIELSSGVIPPEYIEESNVAGQALIAVLNSRHSSPTQDGNTATITGPPACHLTACSSAETYFAASFLAMRETDQTDYEGKPLGWTIWTDTKDEPIAVSKTAGEASTLTIKPSIVNGAPYPAGTILAVTPAVPLDRSARINQSISSATEVSALRLSVWAHAPDERQHLFAKLLADEAKLEPTAHWTVDDLYAAASHALAAQTSQQ